MTKHNGKPQHKVDNTRKKPLTAKQRLKSIAPSVPQFTFGAEDPKPKDRHKADAEIAAAVAALRKSKGLPVKGSE